MRRVIHCVGGVMSPLIFNVAMSVLDEHLHRPWKPGGAMAAHHQRVRRRAKGLPNWRIVRYADDFVVLVDGTRADTEALREGSLTCSLHWGCGCHQPRPASCT